MSYESYLNKKREKLSKVETERHIKLTKGTYENTANNKLENWIKTRMLVITNRIQHCTEGLQQDNGVNCRIKRMEKEKQSFPYV